jgi:hypothetical protein
MRRLTYGWDDVVRVVDLAVVPVKTYQRTIMTPNGPRVVTVTQHDQNYKSGMGGQPAPAGRQGSSPQWQPLPSKSAEKARLLATAKSYRQRAALLRVELSALNSALSKATGTTAAQKGATTAAQAGATTAAQAGATTASTTPSATTAAVQAGATATQVAQTQQQATTAAAGMSAVQLRAAIVQVQARITWYDQQAAKLTAQAAKL